jgi:hypothetical protein
LPEIITNHNERTHGIYIMERVKWRGNGGTNNNNNRRLFGLIEREGEKRCWLIRTGEVSRKDLVDPLPSYVDPSL